MPATPDQDEQTRFERLVQAIRPGATLVQRWPLPGGVSAQVTAVEIAHPDGGSERMVLRCHGVADRERNPNIAADEFRLLQILDEAGLAVPKPVSVDSSGTIFPTPYVVIAYVDGSTDVDPAEYRTAIDQMAAFLVRLHNMDRSGYDLSFLPRLDARLDHLLRAAPPDHELSPEVTRIRAALAAHWPLPRMNAPVLLHGDFWHGNVIRNDGQIAAVIDWEDVAVGDPLADVAKCRLETHWSHGVAASLQFTDRYTANMPELDLVNLPFWELYAALGPTAKLSTWGLDPGTEASMRAVLHEHVERALSALETRSGKL